MGLDPTNVGTTEIIENLRGKMLEFFFVYPFISGLSSKCVSSARQGTLRGAARLLWQIHTPGRVRGSRVTLGCEDGLVGQDSPLLGFRWTLLRWIFYRPSGRPRCGELPLLKGTPFHRELPVRGLSLWDLHLELTEAKTQNLPLFRNTGGGQGHT